MNAVIITAIIVGGCLAAIAMIGGMIFITDYRKDNGYSGLQSTKNRVKAQAIENDAQLKIAAKNKHEAR